MPKLTIDLTPPKVSDFAALQRSTAKVSTIATADDKASALTFLKATLRPRIAALRSFFADIKRPLNDARTVILDKEKATLAPYVALDTQIESAVLAFDKIERDAEQERRRVVERIRQREVEAASDLQRAADELERSNDAESREVANQLRSQAARAVMAPVKPSTPAIATKGRAVTHHAEVRDLAALVHAIATNRDIAPVAPGADEVVGLYLLEPAQLASSHPTLNKLARKYGETLSIPGVVVVPDISIR